MHTLTITILDDTRTFTYHTRERCVSHALASLNSIVDLHWNEDKEFAAQCKREFFQDLQTQNELHTDYDMNNWYSVHINIK